MKNELQYELSKGKLYADIRTCPLHIKVHSTVWLSAFFCAATIKFPWLHKLPDFPRLWAFFPTFPWT